MTLAMFSSHALMGANYFLSPVRTHGLCQALLAPLSFQPAHSKPLPPHPQFAGYFPRFAILILWRKNAVGRNPQAVISGCNPEPLYPESVDSESEIAASWRETSRSAITLVFPTLAHEAPCFQPLAAHHFRKPSRINTCKKQQKNRDRETASGHRRQKPRKKSP